MAGSPVFSQAPNTAPSNLASSSRTCPKCGEVKERRESEPGIQGNGFAGSAGNPVWHEHSEPLQNLPMDRLPKPTPFSKRPKRIILVRHGQSQGNVDASVFTREADWKVPLTELGMQQAEEAGRKIRGLIEKSHEEEDGKEVSDWGVFFYVSPYTRTLQTLRAIGRAFEPHRILGVREEPRLREQDFGNFQVQERMEMTKDARSRFGKFFFRFPEGESAADAYDRVTGFLDSFWRDIEWGRMHPSFREDARWASRGTTRSQSEPLEARPAYSSAVDAAVRASWPAEPTAFDRLHVRNSCGDLAEMEEGRDQISVPTEQGERPSGRGTPAAVSAQGSGACEEEWKCKCERAVHHEALKQAEWGRHRGGGSSGNLKESRHLVRKGGKRCSVNVVVVTHGLLSRVFLMRWFRWTVAQFEGLWNPRNCEIRCMQLTSSGRYSLALQHSDEEMLSWGLSPCMLTDQHARALPEGEEEVEDEDVPPPWSVFFDHVPKGNCTKGPIENHRDHLEAPPSCLDTPI